MAKKTSDAWVGFDLGGTKMLAVVYDDAFKPRGRRRRKTKGNEGAKAGVARIVATIHEALAEAGVEPSEVSGIGIGSPGPLDLDKGVILDTPNLGWKNVPLRATLEKEFSCPVSVLNDVDAGVYGEYRFGAARGARCAVGVFPGTGIGGGCVYEGRILRGKPGSCFEVGHIPVVKDGALCGCGRRGCLETVASRLAIASAAAAAAYRGEAPYLLSEVGTSVGDIRSGTLAAAVDEGDTAVRDIIEDAGRWIGFAMAGVVNLMAPDVVVLGGGLIEAMPTLLGDAVEKSMRKQVMPSFEKSYRVAVAELGDDASVLGAASWAQAVASGKGAGRTP